MLYWAKYGQKGGVIKSPKCIMWPPLRAYSLALSGGNQAFSLARNVGYILSKYKTYVLLIKLFSSRILHNTWNKWLDLNNIKCFDYKQVHNRFLIYFYQFTENSFKNKYIILN